MHVTFISKSSGKSLIKVRSILDRYATRVGNDTWNTPITMEGLEKIKAQLLGIVKRNTAIACYKNDGINRMNLYWVIGNKDFFSENGTIPVHIRKKPKKTLHKNIQIIKKMALLAGLTHDIGKCSINFQNKLRAEGIIRDKISHEWISMRVIEGLIRTLPNTESISKGDALEWFLNSWNEMREFWMVSSCQISPLFHKPYFAHNNKNLKIDKFDKKGGGLKNFECNVLLNSLKIVVATHHAIFSPHEVNDGITKIQGTRHSNRETKTTEKISQDLMGYLHISKRINVEQKKEFEKLSKSIFRVLKTIEKLDGCFDDDALKAATLIIRASLITADHEVSNRAIYMMKPEEAKKQEPLDFTPPTFTDNKNDCILANTERKFGKNNEKIWHPNQDIVYHLFNVGQRAYFWAEKFFDSNDLDGVDREARERLLNEVSPSDFEWQNKSTYILKNKTNIRQRPTLVLNMAATGAGKTRMNIKALAALRQENEPLRIAAGFNLKTLTLQTRDAIKDEIKFPMGQISCIVGDSVALNLHDNPLLADDENEEIVCEKSSEYDCILDERSFHSPEWLDGLNNIYSNKNKQTLSNKKNIIGAPILISTMDYLVHAGVLKNHMHHGSALLRISNSDLILDEIDTYGPIPLASILRVIQCSAIFGRNVVVSSATLPQSISESVFKAYSTGIKMRNSLLGDEGEEFDVAFLDNSGEYCEVETFLSTNDNNEKFKQSYLQNINKKITALSLEHEKENFLRLAKIVPEPNLWTLEKKLEKEEALDEYFKQLEVSIPILHSKNNFQIKIESEERQISFGLIKMANVEPCVKVAEYLAKKTKNSSLQIYSTSYHSIEIPLRRKHKEVNLDKILKRKGLWKQALLKNKEIIEKIKATTSKNICFIVVATPVEEVGRDHDFDWGIIEPSSTASIIQTAGRINRHRKTNISDANIHLLRYNLRTLRAGPEHKNKATFIYPGYEGDEEIGGIYKKNKDLGYLLGGEKPLISIDSLLRFKKSHYNKMEILGCPFAFADESVTKKILEEPLMAIEGKDNYKNSWLIQRYYDKYSLREKLQNNTYFLNHSEENWNLNKVIIQRNKISNKKEKAYEHYQYFNNKELLIDPNDNWWLTLSLNEIKEKQEQLPKQLQTLSMEFSVLSYGDEEKRKFNPIAGGFY